MIKNVTVLGAGTMGHGIAHVFARHGCKVSLYEPFDAVRLSAPKKIREELQFMVDEDYISKKDMENAIANITIWKRPQRMQIMPLKPARRRWS